MHSLSIFGIDIGRYRFVRRCKKEGISTLTLQIYSLEECVYYYFIGEKESSDHYRSIMIIKYYGGVHSFPLALHEIMDDIDYFKKKGFQIKNIEIKDMLKEILLFSEAYLKQDIK